MAENFTKEQLSEYKEAFALFDSNSTGTWEEQSYLI